MRKIILGIFFIFSLCVFEVVDNRIFGSSESNNCTPIKNYELAKENPFFEILEIEILLKNSGGRKIESVIALTKPGVEKSWFKILTSIKKPSVDSKSCSI